MKLITNKPAFTPKEITFVFETQDEIDALAALFTLAGVDAAIKEASGSPNMGDSITDGLEEHCAGNYRNKFEIVRKYLSK